MPPSSASVEPSRVPTSTLATVSSWPSRSFSLPGCPHFSQRYMYARCTLSDGPPCTVNGPELITPCILLCRPSNAINSISFTVGNHASIDRRPAEMLRCAGAAADARTQQHLSGVISLQAHRVISLMHRAACVVLSAGIVRCASWCRFLVKTAEAVKFEEALYAEPFSCAADNCHLEPAQGSLRVGV